MDGGMVLQSLIVSLHDTSPLTFPAVRRQVDELRDLGVTRATLLVIPFHHGVTRLDESPALCGWLRDLQQQAYDLALHGWRHDLVETTKSHNSVSNPARWFFENLYTSRESEFLDLAYPSARDRIARGISLMRDQGFCVRGFVAPAWLMNSEAERAARDEGLLYSNTLTGIIHLPDGARHRTRSCVWSTRTGWRRISSLLWNRVLFHRLDGTNPLRISLHPADMEHPAVWRQIRDLIRRALDQRSPATYADWIRARRTGSNETR